MNANRKLNQLEENHFFFISPDGLLYEKIILHYLKKYINRI